jgi:hypothetical protein
MIASNTSSSQGSYKHQALQYILNAPAFARASFQLHTKDAIADSGATQIFVMEGTPVLIKQPQTCPLCVYLVDGRQVMSTHMCDIKFDGLPFVLTRHIIPDLSIASLFGIRVLNEAGCTITFDKKFCTVRYNSTIILQGKKDVATDLWTLPFGTPSTSTHHGAVTTPSVAPVISKAHAHHATTQIAFFTHTVQNKVNSIQSAHQALCSPHISTLFRAFRRGYLKGCPNLTTHRVLKYLNLSPATAKGHMKRPHQGI